MIDQYEPNDLRPFIEVRTDDDQADRDAERIASAIAWAIVLAAMAAVVWTAIDLWELCNG